MALLTCVCGGKGP
uniref:Uncharacterized protein n=1 Tax=Anguilla anguilla TaxID=7936 RepID=A0A0E9P9J5_ANGAN